MQLRVAPVDHGGLHHLVHRHDRTEARSTKASQRGEQRRHRGGSPVEEVFVLHVHDAGTAAQRRVAGAHEREGTTVEWALDRDGPIRLVSHCAGFTRSDDVHGRTPHRERS